MTEDEWTPEKEREGDPQEVLKRAMNYLNRKMDEDEQTKEKFITAVPASLELYKPPLLSEILERFERVWGEVSIRFNDPNVRIEAFKAIIHRPFRTSDTDNAVQ